MTATRGATLNTVSRERRDPRGADKGARPKGGRVESQISDRKSTPTSPSRRAAVERSAGALTGIYEPDYLATLRDDWPA